MEDGENILQVDGFIREGSAEILWEIDNEEKSVATIVLDIICKVRPKFSESAEILRILRNGRNSQKRAI